MTGVLISENPSKQRPPQWTDYWRLPVLFYGGVPGLPEKVLAEGAPFPVVIAGPGTPQDGRRVVFYIDPSHRPVDERQCDAARDFQPGGQEGRYAFVAGALCDGGTVVTYATATILTGGLTPGQIGAHLDMLHLQLYQALFLGNNHPERVWPQKMFGP